MKVKFKNVFLLKSGSKIHIKKKNRGKFTSYCGGTVTNECIARAKASGNPTLVKRATFAQNARKWKHKDGGILQKFQNGGTQKHAQDVYQGFINQGVTPEVALELTNQQVAEGGWNKYSTGDKQTFKAVEPFTQHVVDWHERMYPDSLKATNFNQFFKGLQNGKYKYNPNSNQYYKHLKSTRPGVKKRINVYRESLGETPLAFVNNSEDPLSAKKGNKLHTWTSDFGRTLDSNPKLDNMKNNYVSRRHK